MNIFKRSYCVITILLFILALAQSPVILSQEKNGHFVVGANTSYVFGGNEIDNPSNLMYSIEAGISYNLLETLRLTGGIGGFRSVMSFYNSGQRMENLNGPMAWIGAEYIFNPNGKGIKPVLALGLGYRLFVPSSMADLTYPSFNEGLFDGDTMLKNTENHIWKYIPFNTREGLTAKIMHQSGAEGIFLRCGIGTDIAIGNLSLNVSIIGELTEFYTGSFAKDTGERYGRVVVLHTLDEDNVPIGAGTKVYTAGKKPFPQRLRGVVGLSIKLLL